MALRGTGSSFSAIARQLGMRRSSDAYDSFHRGLASKSESESRQLVRDELERLDALEARIRSRDAVAPDKMSRRLGGLDQMRADVKRHLGGRDPNVPST